MTISVLEFEKTPEVLCNVIVKNKNLAQTSSDELLSALRTKFTVEFLSDRLRKSAPVFVVFLALIFHSQFSNAGFDAYAGGTLRSYPLAGVMEAESGYHMLLRGTANSPFSSYARVRVYGSSAGIYNSLDGAVEFFPLAIMGVRAGGEGIQNDSKYKAYDCERYECLGRYYRTYIEGELTLGAGPVFVQGRWRRERWTQKNPDQGDFIDPTSAIVIKGQGDSQTVYFGVAGLKLSDKWTFLGVLRYAESDQLEGWSRFPYGVIKYTDGPFSVGIGGGQFESSLKGESFSAVGLLRYEFASDLSVK